MADNTTLNPGTGGDVIASDDIGGVKHQRVKTGFGVDGSYVDVSASDPLPVAGPLTDTQLRATAVPISGALTDTQLRAAAVPVSGPLTDTQLRATAVPVSGPLTDTQLRATAVPVSVGGSVAVTGALTDAELRASPVSVEAYGELIEAIEAMRFAVQALTRSIGQMMPDTAARMRVNVEAGTLPTVTTVGTVTTVATMTNQTQIGGLAATEQIPSLMRLGADSLRRNISVT